MSGSSLKDFSRNTSNFFKEIFGDASIGVQESKKNEDVLSSTDIKRPSLDAAINPPPTTGDPSRNSPVKAPALLDIPTREDAITNVLSKQLEELKRKRARSLGGIIDRNNISTPQNLASTTLFGE